MHDHKDLKSSFTLTLRGINYQIKTAIKHLQPVVLVGAQQDDNFALNFLFYFHVTCNRKKLNLSFPSSYPLSV